MINYDKILIIEDEAIIAEGLKMNLQKLGYEVAGIALNKEAFLDIASSDTEFDIALVDIMLGKKPDGFEIAKYLKEQMGKPFIFATSYTDKDTIQKAKYLNPAGYLVKPFQKKDLLACIEMVNLDQEDEINTQELEFSKKNFFYKDQHLLKKIELENILFVQSFKNYIEVVEESNKHVIRCTMQSFLDKLPNSFVRIQKSFIVNLNFIKAVNSTFVLVNEKEIPLSKNYRDTLIKLMDIL